MAVLSTPSKTPPVEYGHVLRAFENGSIFTETDEKLRQYLLTLGSTRILSEENRARSANMQATIHHILSERAQGKNTSVATKLSRIAIVLSIIATVIAWISWLYPRSTN